MRRRIEAGLALALALSLSIKIATVLAPAAPGPDGSQERLAALFARHGYQVGEIVPHTDPPLLPVTRQGCRLLIAAVSPAGWHRDLLDRLAGPDRRLAFMFGGVVGDTQPVLRTTLAWTRSRLTDYLGLAGPEEPVLAAIAEDECGRSLMAEVARLATEAATGAGQASGQDG